MKALRLAAICSTCLALGFVLIAPSLARADDHLRVTHVSDRDHGDAVMLTLGRLVGARVDTSYDRKQVHLQHQPKFSPRWHYGQRNRLWRHVRRAQHVHDTECGHHGYSVVVHHRPRYVFSAHLGYRTPDGPHVHTRDRQYVPYNYHSKIVPRRQLR